MMTMLHPLMRLHFLLLVLLFCVSPSTFSTNPFLLPSDVACRPHQIQALTEFMNEFDTNHCNHSDPFSEVRCDNSTGEITAIGLGSCLGGTLTPNSSLFRLHHLRYLDLRQNNFVFSTLPYEFGNLNRLEYLSLPNNSFVGQVPSSLSNLSQLSYLDLSQNKLTGSFPLVRNLTKLSILSLANNHFSGPLNPNNRLFELQNLHHLDLGFNNFSSSLPSEFGNLHRLKVLSLSSNDFFGQVPLTISNLTLLTKLSLDRNMLTGSFPLVRNLTNLVSLELSNNLFSGTLNPNSSLFELRNLTYLNLARNNFTSPLPSQFGNFKRLTVLDLSSNNFFGQVPNTISNLTSLAMLALSNNYLAGSFPYSLTTLPSSPRLTYLSLGHNYFEGKIIKSISNLITLQILDLSYLNISYPVDLSPLSSLKSLLYLDLSGNAISPASLGSNSDIPPNLEMLYLSHCGIKEFPNFVKSLHNLLYIHIGNNKIKGKVPEWLWSSLPRLNSVVAVNNSFNGFEGPADVLLNSSVDSIFLQLNLFEGAIPILPLSIKVFAAQENGFTGRIPLSICGYKSLTHLVLPYNNLRGPIPRCLSSLTVLNLRKNNLEGSIPNVFNETLQTLDVGYNRLTGKLPRSLANCSALVFLNVENNRIKDTFPFWLKALPNLQVLILRSNRFYGSISPPDEGPLGFPELRIFEISDNSFNGSLPPDYFVNWKASSLQMNEDMGGIYMEFKTGGYGRGEEGTLSGIFLQFTEVTDLRIKGLSMEQANVLTTYATIDFSGNKLEGQIPESIGLLQGLIALNLSNNAFSGCIPLSLANLTELESLDLSSNKLSGTIPNGLGSLSFLAYVNVSHNQLKGEIPQGTQITGQPKSSFEGNAGLCGFPLEEICFGSNAPPMQQPKEEEEEEEELLNWKAVVMGYGAGVLIGLTIAQVIASYKLEWLIKSC